MAGRRFTLVLVIAFLLGLTYLTIGAAIAGGVDVLTVLSALIIALVLFGVVGALLQRPPE